MWPIYSFDMNRAMKRDAKTVAGWDFTRMIPCHGVRTRVPSLIWDIRLILSMRMCGFHLLRSGCHRRERQGGLVGGVQVVLGVIIHTLYCFISFDKRFSVCCVFALCFRVSLVCQFCFLVPHTSGYIVLVQLLHLATTIYSLFFCAELWYPGID